MRYEIKYTSKFKKDIKLCQKQGKKLEKLFSVVETLASGNALLEKHKDHDLSGKYKGVRECHIEPDWLLVYEKIDDTLVLLLIRTGSHSELF